MVGIRMANVSRHGGSRIRVDRDTQMHLHRATSRNVRIHPLTRTGNQPQLDRAKTRTPQEAGRRRKAVRIGVHSLAG
jgi:hypothetical protein